MLNAHDHSQLRNCNVMMGARAQPQSPWILYFDGATRDTVGNPAGIGAVLKNSRGHTVVELKKLINPGASSAVAKYKALIAGLKKALTLGVEYMLVKGDSRLVYSQVVGHCSVQDDRLVEYQRKVMILSKDFQALFMERICREDNMRADRLANDAIDEELQVVDSLSEFIDQEWASHETHASQNHAVHRHPHPHPHHHQRSRSQTHPLLHATPQLKVKPVASVSPHVVKRHIPLGGEIQAAMKSGDDSLSRRSRLFCPDEELSLLKSEEKSPVARNHSQHVQAAAKSRRKPGRHRLFSTSPTRRLEISASLLPHLDCHEDPMDSLPFSTDESTAASQENLQQVEGNSSGSTGTGEQSGFVPCPAARFETMSSTSEKSLSGDVLFEADYERLFKTLLKGFC